MAYRPVPPAPNYPVRLVATRGDETHIRMIYTPRDLVRLMHMLTAAGYSVHAKFIAPSNP